MESGEDYWMDEKDYIKERNIQEKKRMLRLGILSSSSSSSSSKTSSSSNNNNNNNTIWNNNNKMKSNPISREKLKTEVIAPYKQNWIGLVSVMFIVLSVIITNFPELLNEPVIRIPDL